MVAVSRVEELHELARKFEADLPASRIVDLLGRFSTFTSADGGVCAHPLSLRRNAAVVAEVSVMSGRPMRDRAFPEPGDITRDSIARMAMTLRLDQAREARLRTIAAEENRPMHAVVVSAVDEYAARHQSAHFAALADKIIERHAALLNRLAQ